ncbi:hypothetical protein N0V94_001326 [Neodidymelliopsis sp. IMI 364377]|nr:hypothetical protein N0V94_001326 [Neodidymelliopsis sp. IMI 364377]
MSTQDPEFETSDQDLRSESSHHEASSDDGLIAEEVPSGSKRRMGRQDTRRRRKKRLLERKYVSSPPLPPTAGTEPRSQPLRLAASTETPNVNVWRKAVHELSVNLEDSVRPTEITFAHAELRPLAELRNVAGRDFKYSATLVPVPINWDPQPGDERGHTKFTEKQQRLLFADYRKTVKTWQIHVWDAGVPDEDCVRLRLFPEIKPMLSRGQQDHARKLKEKKTSTEPEHKFVVIGGPLDIDVCPTQEDADRIAATACRLLNKYPNPIESKEFPDELDLRTKFSGFRTLIEMTTLIQATPRFDFRKLRHFFKHNDMMSGCYCLSPTPGVTLDASNNTKWAVKLPVFILDPVGGEKNLWVKAQIDDGTFTEADVDALPDPPSWFGFTPMNPPKDSLPKSSKLSIASMMKLVRWVSWKVFGSVGNRNALHLAPRSVVQNARRRKDAESYGPFNGKPLFQIQRGRYGKDASATIFFSQYVQNTIQGDMPYASTRLPLAGVALALQSSYEVFRDGESILKVGEELFVALDELALGKSILSKDTHCKCEDDASRDVNAHFCMICLLLQPCSTMSRAVDNRLVCNDHFATGPPPSDEYISRFIARSVRVTERPKTGSSLTTDLRRKMEEQLIKEYISPFPTFLDAYWGVHVEKLSYSRAMRASLDAIFPLWKDGSKYYVHHPDNVGITTAFANCLKGDDLPAVVGLAAEALREKDNQRTLDKIERAFDHCAEIRHVIPYSKAGRWEAASKIPDDWWPSYLAAMKSAVWNPALLDPLPPNTQRRVHAGSMPVSEEKEWDVKTIMRLNRTIEEIELDKKYNPRGIELPRAAPTSEGLPGAPWLWHPEHMFQDHSWEFLQLEFEERLARIDRDCDWAHDHDSESAETLFLACVIIWFKLDGGKDEILGTRMTIFARHALRYSIGRALHVRPGSIMLTGWKEKHPERLSDYDDSSRTITMETWVMNRGKKNYSVEKESVAEWTDYLRGVSQVTEFYDIPALLEQTLDAIDWPSKWNRAAEGEYEDEDLEDIQEQKDDLADEENEALNLEDTEGLAKVPESSSMAHPDLSTSADILSFMAQFIPEEARGLYESSLSVLVAQVKNNLPPSDEEDATLESRFDSFKYIMSVIVDDMGWGRTWAINQLASWDLEDWQKLDDAIDRSFSVDEMVSFCCRLDKEGKVKFLLDTNNGHTFTWEPEKDKGKGRAK